MAEAVYRAFEPDKLNYELLGIGENVHMHWHFFPRREKDTPLPGLVWRLESCRLYDKKYLPKTEELEEMKNRLNSELDRLLGVAGAGNAEGWQEPGAPRHGGKNDIDKRQISNLDYDTSERAVIQPVRQELSPFPQKAVFAFLGEEIERYALANQGELLDEFETITGIFPIYACEYKGERICMCQAPLGSAAAVQFDRFIRSDEACGRSYPPVPVERLLIFRKIRCWCPSGQCGMRGHPITICRLHGRRRSAMRGYGLWKRL